MRVLRFVFWCALVIGTLASAAVYALYTPAAPVPHLSGTLSKGSIEIGGRTRTYTTYVPRGLAKGASLIVAMHGSGESAADMRRETGYGFDRLADEHGFAVVYPNGFEGYWNGCNIVGNFSANTLNIDDVGFLNALAEKLIAEIGVAPGRVFATGVSRGGSMAIRLALEAPSHFRAVASVSDSVPAPDNFKCRLPENGTSSVMIMNGTDDPLVPFNGGNVSLFGLFVKRGKVLSSEASRQYFTDLNHHASRVEVELVVIHGGGHGIPQPYHRHARLLGPSPSEPNGPDVIWKFFDRQRP